jgi:hypothetical protein
MKNKDYESAVTDFLAKPENLDLAIDIAAQLENVKKYLLDRFWEELVGTVRNRLHDEHLWVLEENAVDDNVSIRPSQLPQPPNAPQIKISIEDARANAYYGLEWNRKVRDPERERICAEVPQVADLLKLQLFDDWERPEEWWAVWEYLDSDQRSKTTLMRLSKNEPVGAEVAKHLVDLFEKVGDQVGKANNALLEAYRAGRLNSGDQ